MRSVPVPEPNNELAHRYCMECSSDHVDHAVGSVKDAAISAVQNMTSLANAARDRHGPLQVRVISR